MQTENFTAYFTHLFVLELEEVEEEERRELLSPRWLSLAPLLAPPRACRLRVAR